MFVEFTLPVKFTFYEQGLPEGTRWSVFINGSYYNTTSSFILVNLSNGTYSYFVVVPPNYAANPAQGKINYSNNLVIIKATSFLIYEITIAILIILVGVFVTIYLRARGRVSTTKREQTRGDKDSEKKV